MTTTNYIWDEQNYLAEADETNTINVVYTNEPQQYGNLISTRLPISGTPTSFYHHFDAVGSTRQLSTSTGFVSDTVIYDAWGNAVGRSGTTAVMLLWVGELGYYFDPEAGLVYVRERICGPVSARWTSVDPLGFVNGLNRYVVVRNTPVVDADPSGAQPNAWAIPLDCKKRESGPFDWAQGGVSNVHPIKGAFFSCVQNPVGVQAGVFGCDKWTFVIANMKGLTKLLDKVTAFCDSLYHKPDGPLDEWKALTFAQAEAECKQATRPVPGKWNADCPCTCPKRRRSLRLGFEVIMDIWTPAGKTAACFRTCNAIVQCTGSATCGAGEDWEGSGGDF